MNAPSVISPRRDLVAARAQSATLNLFAGPGGMDMGMRILGLDEPHGVDLSASAVATAQAAGFGRTLADVRTLNPVDFGGTTGLIVTPPCPTFNTSGLRSGLDDDYQHVLDAITCLGEGCDCGWAELPELVSDPRTALAAEVARWALRLPDVEWLVAEQVPALEYAWEDIAAELASHGWEYFDVFKLNSLDLGVCSRRIRVFLVGRKYRPSGVTYPLGKVYESATMAAMLGWGTGHRVRTRGNRRPTGGNLFSADGPSWCLTGKARTWERAVDGLRLTASQAGTLNGFPADYPWQGSRTAQFHQIGDVVAPPVAAAVLGTALGVEWLTPVGNYLAGLPGGATELEMACVRGA